MQLNRQERCIQSAVDAVCVCVKLAHQPHSATLATSFVTERVVDEERGIQ